MKTQIQPTPIITGKAAERIEEFLKIEPTDETEIGKKILEKEFKEKERSMNKIKYSDLDKWNDWDVGCVLDRYVDEIKNAESYSEEAEAIKARYVKLVKLQVVNFGHIMENEAFAQCVESGGFTSYDGVGYYMNSLGEETRCSVSFNPDVIRSKAEDFPYVAWYNK